MTIIGSGMWRTVVVCSLERVHTVFDEVKIALSRVRRWINAKASDQMDGVIIDGDVLVRL